MLKKLLVFTPVLIALCVVFITFGFMPTFVKVLWSVLFIIAWCSRKLIRENLISWLQTIDNDRLQHILWIETSSKSDENGKKTHERKPNETSLTAIRLLVSVAIFVLFLGIPLLIYWILSAIFGFFAGIWHAFEVIVQDLMFTNGVGFFIFALAEILVTIAAICFVIYLFKNDRKFSKRNKRLAVAGALFVQRLISWFYYEYTFGGVIGELIGWVVFVAIMVFAFRYGPTIFARFRKHHTPTPGPHRNPEPIETEFEEVDEDFDPLS